MIQLRAQHSTARATWDPSRLAEPCVSVSVIGSMLSILVITIDGMLRPGYSATAQAISDLGVGLRAWLLNIDLIVTGLLFVLFAIGFHQAMRATLDRKRLNFVTALFALAGVGILNDGFCTEYNPRNPTVPHAILRNNLHVFGFYIAICALTIAFFVIGARLRNVRAWRRYGRFSLISGFVVLALVVVYGVLPGGAKDFAGLIERMIVGAAFGWQFVTGYFLLRPRSPLAHAPAYKRLRKYICGPLVDGCGQALSPRCSAPETPTPPSDAWQSSTVRREQNSPPQNTSPPTSLRSETSPSGDKGGSDDSDEAQAA